MGSCLGHGVCREGRLHDVMACVKIFCGWEKCRARLLSLLASGPRAKTLPSNRQAGARDPPVPMRVAQRVICGRCAQLHAWIAATLGGDLSVERLAEQAKLAPRTFARVHAAKLARTPAKTVEAIRMEAGCRALEETGLPLKSIAMAAGYGDEQTSRRAFLRQLGVSPYCVSQPVFGARIREHLAGLTAALALRLSSTTR